jgi:hypothetical protein
MCFQENSFPTFAFYYDTTTPFPFYIYIIGIEFFVVHLSYFKQQPSDQIE